MNKLGSEFLRVFDDYERPFFANRTKRELAAWLVMILGGAISVVFYLYRLPEVLLYLILFLVCTPLMLYRMGKDREYKEKYGFLLRVQERSYQTDFIEERRYTKYDFIPQKGVRETD